MKKKQKHRYLSPAQARTHDDQCKLNRDNINGRRGWILLDGASVSIAEQTVGESAKAIVSLSRSDFEKLVRWYFKPQKLRASNSATGESK